MFGIFTLKKENQLLVSENLRLKHDKQSLIEVEKYQKEKIKELTQQLNAREKELKKLRYILKAEQSFSK